MRLPLHLSGLTGMFILVVAGCGPGTSNTEMKAPKAKKIDTALTMHGHTRIDPWYWLNERENPEVIDYLEAENAYTAHILAKGGDMETALFQEITHRIPLEDSSVPFLDNGYLYYRRYDKGAEYPLHFRRIPGSETEELMLDVPEMAKGFAYYHLTGLSVSPDQRYLAFAVDTVSRRQYTIYIKDLSTGRILPDKIENTSGECVWAADNQTLFYTVKDASLRAAEVWKHSLGSETSDLRVFEEGDPTFSLSLSLTTSREFILIESSSTLSDEVLMLPSDNPEGTFSVFLPRERGHEYSIDHDGVHFYIKTNWDARNFRLMRTTADQRDKAAWEEVAGARDKVLLDDMLVLRDYLILNEREDGLTRFHILPKGEEAPFYLPFWEETYAADFGPNWEMDARQFRFHYSSLTTPNSVYDFDLETRELRLMKEEKVLGDFSSEDFVAERRYYPSHDGTMIPVSLVYKKDLLQKLPAPMILYGYGSYGYSTDPYFSSARLSLLNRGFIFAIAHIRGGQEMGRQWYEEGKLLKKKNTFHDFIACAEGLISEGYTQKESLYGVGGSAGGLLVGAVANMRPDLFHGIVAQVPFVDVVTTMLDASIPLTTGEYDEWGNPEDKVYYDYMLSYSPYDNVEAKDYPHILVSTGLHDSQVQYWEPAKWVARLRDMKTDQNLLLLHTDMETGHGGASGRFAAYQDVARYYAFILLLQNQ